MDRYTVLKVIGEGSFGRALLVQLNTDKVKWVMKEIRLPKVTYDDLLKSQQIKNADALFMFVVSMHTGRGWSSECAHRGGAAVHNDASKYCGFQRII